MELVTTFTICQFFKEDPNLVKRGQNALTSGHVINAAFDGSNRARGVVKSSYKKKSYSVEVSFF